MHPEGALLARRLAPWLADERISIEPGDEPRIYAEIATPSGPKVLS
jgi:hypothetical protein